MRSETNQYYKDPNRLFQTILDKNPNITHIATDLKDNPKMNMTLFPFEL